MNFFSLPSIFVYLLGSLPGGGGGGVLDQWLGIGVPLRVSNPDHV